jgi:glycosyltransferase involved in cell wall biosynthesis
VIITISITLFFLILRFTVTVFNFISNPKLTRVNRQYNDLVSILIPARNEEDKILSLLESIDQQDYPNYEVIIYDDDSSDGTYAVCSLFAANHPRFKVIKGDDLPAGWSGKKYACDQLARQADGKSFLFLDADVCLVSGLINSLLHRMHLYKLGLLSVFPDQLMPTAGEKITVPLIHYLLLNLLPLRMVYLIKSGTVSAASGQCMMFDAGVYNKHQWHKQVNNEKNGAVEIMRLVKTKRYNCEVLLSNGMIRSRKYSSYREVIDGLGRNLLTSFNFNIPALLIYILLVVGGPMVVLMTLNLNLIFFMASLIVLSRIMTSLPVAENAGYNVILHPLQMTNLVIIAFLSIKKYLTKTDIWKGRRI